MKTREEIAREIKDIENKNCINCSKDGGDYCAIQIECLKKDIAEYVIAQRKQAVIEFYNKIMNICIVDAANKLISEVNIIKEGGEL